MTDQASSSVLTSGKWRCDVCHRVRPDAQIGVAKHAHMNAAGVVWQENVKFCKDNLKCRREARVNGLTMLQLKFTQKLLHEELDQHDPGDSFRKFCAGLCFGGAFGILIPLNLGWWPF